MSTMKTTRDVKGVGVSIPRPDGPEKVTGRVQYVADIKPRGMLHAKLLRSPHAHANILRIDTSRAKAYPGVRHGVPQCGFCIPGVLMAATALLAENPSPTEEEIRYGIAGNLCRCTGYTKMITAIAEAAPATAALRRA